MSRAEDGRYISESGEPQQQQEVPQQVQAQKKEPPPARRKYPKISLAGPRHGQVPARSPPLSPPRGQLLAAVHAQTQPQQQLRPATVVQQAHLLEGRQPASQQRVLQTPEGAAYGGAPLLSSGAWPQQQHLHAALPPLRQDPAIDVVSSSLAKVSLGSAAAEGLKGSLADPGWHDAASHLGPSSQPHALLEAPTLHHWCFSRPPQRIDGRYCIWSDDAQCWLRWPRSRGQIQESHPAGPKLLRWVPAESGSQAGDAAFQGSAGGRFSAAPPRAGFGNAHAEAGGLAHLSGVDMAAAATSAPLSSGSCSPVAPALPRDPGGFIQSPWQFTKQLDDSSRTSSPTVRSVRSGGGAGLRAAKGTRPDGPQGSPPKSGVASPSLSPSRLQQGSQLGSTGSGGAVSASSSSSGLSHGLITAPGPLPPPLPLAPPVVSSFAGTQVALEPFADLGPGSNTGPVVQVPPAPAALERGAPGEGRSEDPHFGATVPQEAASAESSPTPPEVIIPERRGASMVLLEPRLEMGSAGAVQGSPAGALGMEPLQRPAQGPGTGISPTSSSSSSSLATSLSPSPRAASPVDLRVPPQPRPRCEGGWDFINLCGRGAAGEVWKAENLDTGEAFAVKKVPKSDDETKTNELAQEVDLLRQLSHPHIVSYIGYEVDELHVYIFMEYLDESVSARLKQYRQRPGTGSTIGGISYGGSRASSGNAGSPLSSNSLPGFPEPLLSKYTRQLLDGLAYLHSQNIMHRDIKGANILLDGRRGIVKLADFGVAKKLANMRLMENTALKGTMLFMAPEVIDPKQGQGYLGEKADIWSLGCTVIEMATGMLPWIDPVKHTAPWGNPMEQFQAMQYIATREHPPPFPPGASAVLRDFLSQCLNLDPEQRPSAAQLLHLHPFVAPALYPLSLERHSSASPPRFGSSPSVTLFSSASTASALGDPDPELDRARGGVGPLGSSNMSSISGASSSGDLRALFSSPRVSQHSTGDFPAAAALLAPLHAPAKGPSTGASGGLVPSQPHLQAGLRNRSSSSSGSSGTRGSSGTSGTAGSPHSPHRAAAYRSLGNPSAPPLPPPQHGHVGPANWGDQGMHPQGPGSDSASGPGVFTGMVPRPGGQANPRGPRVPAGSALGVQARDPAQGPSFVSQMMGQPTALPYLPRANQQEPISPTRAYAAQPLQGGIVHAPAQRHQWQQQPAFEQGQANLEAPAPQQRLFYSTAQTHRRSPPPYYVAAASAVVGRELPGHWPQQAFSEAAATPGSQQAWEQQPMLEQGGAPSLHHQRESSPASRMEHDQGDLRLSDGDDGRMQRGPRSWLGPDRPNLPLPGGRLRLQVPLVGSPPHRLGAMNAGLNEVSVDAASPPAGADREQSPSYTADARVRSKERVEGMLQEMQRQLRELGDPSLPRMAGTSLISSSGAHWTQYLQQQHQRLHQQKLHQMRAQSSGSFKEGHSGCFDMHPESSGRPERQGSGEALLLLPTTAGAQASFRSSSVPAPEAPLHAMAAAHSMASTPAEPWGNAEPGCASRLDAVRCGGGAKLVRTTSEGAAAEGAAGLDYPGQGASGAAGRGGARRGAAPFHRQLDVSRFGAEHSGSPSRSPASGAGLSPSSASTGRGKQHQDLSSFIPQSMPLIPVDGAPAGADVALVAEPALGNQMDATPGHARSRELARGSATTSLGEDAGMGGEGAGGAAEGSPVLQQCLPGSSLEADHPSKLSKWELFNRSRNAARAEPSN